MRLHIFSSLIIDRNIPLGILFIRDKVKLYFWQLDLIILHRGVPKVYGSVVHGWISPHPFLYSLGHIHPHSHAYSTLIGQQSHPTSVMT